MAAAAGNKRSLRVLLRDGRVDVNKRDSNMMTALHMAVDENRTHTTTELLDHATTDVNARGLLGLTPMHVTVIKVSHMYVLTEQESVT